MAENLRRAGQERSVYNRTREVLITMLADDAAVGGAIANSGIAR